MGLAVFVGSRGGGGWWVLGVGVVVMLWSIWAWGSSIGEMWVGGHVLGSGVVGGVWVLQALHCNVLSCVWVWVLALGRERVWCRIVSMTRGVGSLIVLGVAVPVGIGRVAGMGGGSGSRLARLCGMGVGSIVSVCCIVLFRFCVGLYG